MRSVRNKTLQLSEAETAAPIHTLPQQSVSELRSGLYCGDVEHGLQVFPSSYFDLIVADPPYNYGIDFGNDSDKRTDREYSDWVNSWITQLERGATPTASFYICCGWEYSGLYQRALHEAGLTIINRITWKRDKGRGAKRNWKQNMEDIWFAVRNPKDYAFNLDQVKVRKKVIAPYRENGIAKDWSVDELGEAFRMTHPSNIWVDLTVPFWSMPENTPHPTQKPEALAERIILASSKPGDRVLDLFSGSGTVSVVAKKLQREFVGVEMNTEYVRYAMKRIAMAQSPQKTLDL